MKKLFKTRGFMYRVSAVLLFALLFTASCMDEAVKADDEDPAIDKAEYDLKIAGYHLKGENIESNWDSSLGIVWLGTDKNIEPTGTLTIFIDSLVTTSSGENVARIASASLSHVDQLVGTGPEINGKTYVTVSEDEIRQLFGVPYLMIFDVKIGANYISGRISILDDEGDVAAGWPMREVNSGEVYMLFGTFTAIVER
jgi:hypothetical protein